MAGILSSLSSDQALELIYIGYFNRSGDPNGFVFWEGQYAQGVAGGGSSTTVLDNIADAFAPQAETAALYPFLATANPNYSSPVVQAEASSFINSVYMNLFNRAADPTGLAYWLGQLESGKVPLGQMILDIANGAQAGSADYSLLTNKVSTALAFTEQTAAAGIGTGPTPSESYKNEASYVLSLDTSSSTTAASTEITNFINGTGHDNNGTGGVFTLTTGVDAPGAGAFLSTEPTGNALIYGTFNTANATYTAGDQVIASGDNNQLILSDGGAHGGNYSLNIAGTVSGVQTVQVDSAEAVTLNAVSAAAGYTGLQNFIATTASGGGGGADSFTVAATTNVNVSDAASGAGAAGVTVAGGDNIVVNESGVSTTGGATAITIGGTAATDPAGTVTVGVTGAGDTSVAIGGGTTINVNTSQTGGVTVGAGATATDPTGNVTVTATSGGAVTVDGGVAVTANVSGGVGAITIGSATTASLAPTGAIVASESGISFESGVKAINAFGGTGATATTTGGSVTLGSSAVEINGNATIVDTNYGNISTDALTAVASGAVSITTDATSGAITVGGSAGLDSTGMVLAHPLASPDGAVTIVNESVGNSTTGVAGTIYYGTSVTNVNVNGSTSVSITGAGATTITDLQTTPATGGTNAGDAIGASTLATVALDNVSSATITDNALANLSVASSSNSAVTVNETTANPSATADVTSLSVMLANDGAANSLPVFSLTDASATSLTIGASGANPVALALSAAADTTLTFDNAAALTLNSASLAKVTTIVADNSGSLALGDISGLAKLTSINATGSTGAVSVTLDEGAASTISFNGVGGGQDTVTIDSNTLGTGTSIKAAAGSVIVANYNAATTDTALSTETSGFTTLKVGDVNSDNGAVAGSVYAPAHAAVAAVAQMDTISITGTYQTGDVVDVKVGAGTDYSTTVTVAETDAQIAQALFLAALPNGYADSYTAGATSFTIAQTAASAGTPLPAVTDPTFVAHQIATTTLTAGTSGTHTYKYSMTINGITYTSAAEAANTTAVTDATALVTAINATAPSYIVASNAGGTSATVTVTDSLTSSQTVALSSVSVSSASQAGGGVGTAASFSTVSTTTAPAEAIAVTTPNGAASAAVTDAYYDATGFTALSVGATTGDVTFMNAASGTPLTVTASQGGGGIVEYVLAKTAAATDTLNLTVGVDGASGSTGVTTTVATALNTASFGNTPVIASSIETTLAINSVGHSGTNTITIGDTAATTITIAGDSATNLTLDTDALAGQITATSNVTSITVAAADTAAVNVSGVVISAAGATITGSGGMLTADGSGSGTAKDVFNVGTGGGDISLGAGGSTTGFVATDTTVPSSWTTYASGSETVNLTANNLVASTINVGANTNAVVNNFAATAAPASADVLTFTAPEMILANQVATNVNFINGGLQAAISNGIITFSATSPDSLSNYSTAALVSAAAEVMDNARINLGGPTDAVTAFSSGGNTYVVTDQAGTISVTELAGVTGIQGFGTTAAANTIVSTDVTDLVAASANTGTVAGASIFNEAGYAIFNDITQTVGTTSTTLNNLAASAQLNIAGTDHALTVNQMAAAGGNSLTINEAGPAASITTLTLNGDSAVTFATTVGDALTITSLVDGGSSLGTINVTGAGSLTINGVTSTALTTINDSAHTGAFTLVDALNMQTIELGSGTISLTAEGQGDSITQVGSSHAVTGMADGNADFISLTGNVGTAGTHFSAAGANDTIYLGNNTNYLDAINNDVSITLGSGANTITATGSGDTVTFAATQSGAASSVTIGADATVTFGNSSTHGQSVVLTANSETQATSSGVYQVTTLENVVHYAGPGLGDRVDFTAISAGTDTFTTSAVNVAAATSLAQALDAAAHINTTSSGNNLVWFQFGGNTYIEDNVGATHTALGTSDVVIEVTGLVNLSTAALAGAHVLHL